MTSSGGSRRSVSANRRPSLGSGRSLDGVSGRPRRPSSSRRPSTTTRQNSVEESGLSISVRRSERRQPPWKRLFPHAKRMTSLDNLYAQAAAVQTMLNAKVAWWGFESDGLCALRGGGGFAAWRAVGGLSRAEQSRELKRGVVKRPRRAAEKLNRAYGGDASRLLDITRDCIVFEHAAQLATCVGLMHADEDVEIVGIKNRLCPKYDARQTFGYRDVALIIRFRTEAAERRKLDLHLCELQLLLKDFALLKNEEGHARYVKLRDARGE